MKEKYLKRDIKLIAFDMDGTMLNEKSEMSQYTVEVLNKAVRKGIKLVPITGRTISILLPVISQVEGIDHVITSNGAVITDIANNSIIKDNCLSKDTVKKIYELLTSLGLDHRYNVNGYGFNCKGKPTAFSKLIKNPSRFKIEMDEAIIKYGIEEALVTKDYPVEKISITFDSLEVKLKTLEQLQRLVGITISYAFELGLEVNNLGATKGNGLEYISKLYNILLENIMAIGDGTNDITMLQKAGIGVAMGNSLEGVKDYADYVTLRNDENGAAKAIEKFVF